MLRNNKKHGQFANFNNELKSAELYLRTVSPFLSRFLGRWPFKLQFNPQPQQIDTIQSTHYLTTCHPRQI